VFVQSPPRLARLTTPPPEGDEFTFFARAVTADSFGVSFI